MRAVAGKVLHSTPDMNRWRKVVSGAALRSGGLRWEPVTGPCVIDVCFTVPFPRGFRSQSGLVEGVDPDGVPPRIPVMQPPDRDKLLRAVQDALSLHDLDADSQFRLVADDALFVDGATAKTYPRPGHTHAWALERPGVVIRVSLPDSRDLHWPRVTLSADPGSLPEGAAVLDAAIATQAASLLSSGLQQSIHRTRMGGKS
jgi:hypothetical protein